MKNITQYLRVMAREGNPAVITLTTTDDHMIVANIVDDTNKVLPLQATGDSVADALAELDQQLVEINWETVNV